MLLELFLPLNSSWKSLQLHRLEKKSLETQVNKE